MAQSDIRLKWSILAAVTLVSFITNVDATIVVIGLPRLMSGLHISVVTGLWTITSYIITSTVFLLPAGRWSDLIGTKKIFIAGLAIFTVATFLCGIANSGSALIVYRFIQGTGAALALATATPIIVKAFPANELGKALGINSTSWVIGSIVGPVAGGALINAFGWRSIFFVTIPFAIIGMIAAMIVLRADVSPKQQVKSDWLGMITFGLGLVGLLVSLSEGQSWGWLSLRTLGLFVLTLVLFISFVWIELRVKAPLFNLSLVKHRHYSAGLGVTFSYSIGYFATTFLLTLYLQGALRLSPLSAGLLLIPLSAPQLVMGPLGGAAADRFGPARLVLVGVFFLGLGVYFLGSLGPQLSVMAIILPQLLMSTANGLGWPALTKAVLSSAPREQTGAASGMFYTFRNVGMSLSLTLALVVAEVSVPPSVASQAFLGTAGVLSTNIKSALVNSTDKGFQFFILFYAIAFICGLVLLRPHRSGQMSNSTVSTQKQA
ncbi:DHA2 family efflux MFS transporter permease subunit [Alicyclobacillus tolerans]|uniref:EmrB/QacA subfamily drug resistance transporter n=1 Tax=Alicyclobacillus tolerans TaxID=90970 RepID=A0ABT9LVH6_9BACL|nr:DHA2 family efflux MFS transporter permease subunit [Alicyclobacillus tengchongensis]MDP9728260.1 EmrB/QacA subfamily drug resistance transporter [Alicyclobacillus tengchongensis]